MSSWARWRWRLGGALGLAIASSACGLSESDAPKQVSHMESCQGGVLEDYCAPYGCSPSPDSVRTVCQHPGGVATTTRGPTDCGGTLVQINYGTHAESYFFDKDELLVGVSLTSDTAQPCPSGGESLVTTYGTACAASDPQATLPCPSGAGGGPSALGGSAGSAGMPSTNCPGTGGAPHAPGFPQPWTRRTDLTEATTCTAEPSNQVELADACACAGLTCAAEASCLAVSQPAPNVVGGDGGDFNGCFPLCKTDTDCETPALCVGNMYGVMVCDQVECRQDSDCTADPCGFCLQGYFVGHAGLILSDPSSSRCEYPGACSAASCASCTASELGWHHCGG